MCVCLWTLRCTNVTSPPVFKLWDTQGYLCHPYDLTEVINLFGVTFKQKIKSFKKIVYVIPSALVSFLPYYCHSFQIIVISSGLLSFLPDYSVDSIKRTVHLAFHGLFFLDIQYF